MKSNGILRIFFFSLPVLYFIFYGPYGMDDIDCGYTIGCVHRLVNGQIPYRDFILVRPPFSIYLHSIPYLIIPPDYLLIAERLIVYLNFGLTAWVSTEVINAHFDLKKYKLDKYLLASIIFVFSVHNYSPMTMHTTDGVMLAAIGIYFLAVKPSSWRICFGMLFLFLAALTKQSYYPMPFAGLLYIAVTQPGRNILTGAASLLCVFAAAYFLASHYDLIRPFIFWTAGSTNMEDFIHAGFWQYIEVIRKHLKSLAVIVAGFFILKIILKLAFKKTLEYGWLFLAFALKSFLAIIRESYLFHGVFIKTENPYSHPQVFFIVTIAGILYYVFRQKRISAPMITLCFLLSLSWCVSLSWGYQTPVIFSAPLMFGILWINGELGFRHLRFFSYFLLIGGIISFSVAYYYCPNHIAIIPTRDSTRPELTYDMGKIFPKLSCIRSDKETFEKYTELKSLAGKYGNNFKTLPGIPFSNYLTDTKSPIRLDWPMEREINNHTDSIIQQLNSSDCYAFVESDQFTPAKSILYGWGSTSYVVDNWKMIEETNYFRVYHMEDSAEVKN